VAVGDSQFIPPDALYRLTPVGAARFAITFFAVDRAPQSHDGGVDQSEAPGDPSGGDPPCLASAVCPDCGVVLDGSPHRLTCSEEGRR